MTFSANRRSALVALASFSAANSACSLRTDARVDLPDEISGLVIDRDTGVPLNGARISVLINERGYRATIGPEGTAKPMVAKVVAATTGSDGIFSLDLQRLKADLMAKHGVEGLAMWKPLSVKKEGYEDLFEPYTGPGQTLRLKKDK
jgi:hypothetical protein